MKFRSTPKAADITSNAVSPIAGTRGQMKLHPAAPSSKPIAKYASNTGASKTTSAL